MSKIITISREFGSGGRELGKRLADALGIPCYDHQIIEMVAEKTKLNKNYVASMDEKDIQSFYPSTISHGFSMPSYAIIQSAEIINAEQELIKKLASEGDCIIIGRAADVILAEYKPFSVFVCADSESKIARCRARAKDGENFTDKQILRKCKTIDKQRRMYREVHTNSKWGSAASFNLCINTSGKEIKKLLPAVITYINTWFEEE